jgi:DNA repair exonuclease SbcCD ATPase subunit
MRLASLEIEGFRGFARRQRLDLDADAVVVVGANGSGKTSLFDASLWALTGSLPRVEDPGGSVVSEFARSGEARVALQLVNETGERLTIVRSRLKDDDSSRLQLQVADDVLRGTKAQVELFERIWPDALSAPDGNAALSLTLTRSVYLQQDLVRQFVEADSDGERFEAVSELVGVGRVRELQLGLEAARRAWSQATNALEREGEPNRVRLNDLEAQLSKLASESSDESALVARWRDWWRKTAEQLGEPHGTAAPFDSGEATRMLDDALRRLTADSRSNDRRLVEARSLLQELIEATETPDTESKGLDEALNQARAQLAEAQKALNDGRNLAAEQREAAISSQEHTAQLAALAELALRHLGERCPVCMQSYDHDATLVHLENMRAAATSSEQNLPTLDLEGLAASVSRAESLVHSLETEIATQRSAKEARRLASERRSARLAELEIKVADAEERVQLERLIDATEKRDLVLGALHTHGEEIALALARTGEVARRNELLRERESLSMTTSREAHEIVERRSTGETAGQLLDVLRDAAAELVGAQLKQIEPLVQRIYARVDPHPAFRNVALNSSFQRGRGRVHAQVADEITGASASRPGTVLSSSQLNALAVSVFLALNLGVPAVPLASVLLDDPLQSLDDVNLLGLVDLLRRTKQRRQLLISTHDPRFAALLERKLRPIGSSRTLITELSGWRRDGPEIVQREVPSEEYPLRLVA